jgi:hypothetical protein
MALPQIRSVCTMSGFTWATLDVLRRVPDD